MWRRVPLAVNGLEIFYREAGPERRAHDSSSTWVAVVLPEVPIAAGIYSSARKFPEEYRLACPLTKASLC